MLLISSGFFEAMSMGLLEFYMFASYSINFWFGYKLIVEEPKNYDVDTMIAVSKKTDIN